MAPRAAVTGETGPDRDPAGDRGRRRRRCGSGGGLVRGTPRCGSDVQCAAPGEGADEAAGHGDGEDPCERPPDGAPPVLHAFLGAFLGHARPLLLRELRPPGRPGSGRWCAALSREENVDRARTTRRFADPNRRDCPTGRPSPLASPGLARYRWHSQPESANECQGGPFQMSLQPLDDRIVVRPGESEETTASGLVIPDTAKEKPQQGEVLGRRPRPPLRGHRRADPPRRRRSATPSSTPSTAAPSTSSMARTSSSCLPATSWPRSPDRSHLSVCPPPR